MAVKASVFKFIENSITKEMFPWFNNDSRYEFISFYSIFEKNSLLYLFAYFFIYSAQRENILG